jgi:RNA-directed DNA polymerase
MSITAWHDIDWSLIEKRILRYQTRIYKATKDGNISKTKCLQKRLLKSLDAKLMSVRRVTTLNKGRKNKGVDGKIYVTDIEKINLVKRLRLDGKALPLRRVYIPKPGVVKENWLPHMSWVKSKKHVKIRGTSSPFDGDNLYWGKRT